MKKEYLVAELCEQELNGIDEKTFRRNKDNYLKQLGESNHVTQGKRGRFTTIILEPKEQSSEQKEDAEFLEIIGCDIGKHDIELLKFWLKSILEKEIVPTQEELANIACQNNLIPTFSRGTIKGYFDFLKKHHIIVKPTEIPTWIRYDGVVPEYDKETGEILPTYYKKVVNYIYYDYAKDGRIAFRKRLMKVMQEIAHQAYGTIYGEEYKLKIIPLIKSNASKSYIAEESSKLQMKVLQELGEAYGINALRRMPEPIININIAGRLKDYFGLRTQGRNKELNIDVSKVELVEIDRPIGSKTTELEAIMEYRQLLNSHVQLYTEGQYAMPIHLYEKWHGAKKFEARLNGNTNKVLESDEDILSFDEMKELLAWLKKYKKVNVETLSKGDVTETIDNQLLQEEMNFKKQLSAFKFKPPSEVTNDDATDLMKSMFANKQKGVV
ncbi:hypothetical protein [Sporosarcina psychrophila]|uniref:hypothetical protein n=1 Tax=Sporosarcina psychrophila TaxID=1476 RepID=UPI00078C7B20|nr:hypothetical protein [Sporosarcina psychrophila]AMQ05908.1 hypothetical protein AZE41_08250 [Sporosarcina psychrophila]